MTAAVGAQKLSAGTWAIDPVHSSINFSVRHLMVGKIHGRFDQFSGAITITEDGTPSVTAEIDVNSVDTGNEQREAHIKAADFFGSRPSNRPDDRRRQGRMRWRLGMRYVPDAMCASTRRSRCRKPT